MQSPRVKYLYICPFIAFLQILFFGCFPFIGLSQTKVAELKKQISTTKKDTSKITLYEKLGEAYYEEKKMDSSVFAYKKALAINKKYNYSPLRQSWNLAAIDYKLFEMGNYSESLYYAALDLALAEKMKYTREIGFIHLIYGHDYREMGYYRLSLNYYFKAKNEITAYSISIHQPADVVYLLQCIGNTYLKMNRLDSALFFTKQAYNLAMNVHSNRLVLYSWRIFGDIYFIKADYQKALYYYRLYIPGYTLYEEKNRDLGFVLNKVATIFKRKGKTDSAVYYAKKALANAQKYTDQENIYTASNLLYTIYNGGNDQGSYSSTKNYLEKASETVVGRNKPVNGVDQNQIHSLKKELILAKTDSARVTIIRAIEQKYVDAADLDTAIRYGEQALEFVQKSKLPVKWEIWQYTNLNNLACITSNYTLSLQYAGKALILSERSHNYEQMAFSFSAMAEDYAGMGNLRRALDYFFKSKKAFENFESGHWAIQNIAEIYLKMHKPDSALYYNRIAYHIADTMHNDGFLHNNPYMMAFAVRVFAAIFAEKGEDKSALNYYKRFVTDFYKYNLNNREIDRAYLGIAKLYRKKNNIDSSLFYAKYALNAAKTYNDQEHVLLTSKFLYNLNDSLHNESEAFKYFKIATAAKDSIASIEKIRQFQNLTFNEQAREKELAAAEAKEAAKIRLLLIIGSVLIAIAVFLIWARIRQLLLRNKMILEQKELEKLRTIDKMKEEFFSNITHELKTPLSLIIGPAQFYLEHPNELADTKKLLHGIYKNSGYLLNLINQLLDISKIDAGKMPVTLSAGDFGVFIAELVQTFEDKALLNNVKLNFTSNFTGRYLFDDEHWKKIINNLLANALKFTPAGGSVTVNINKISTLTNSVMAEIIVKDTGIGIDENDIPFITDRFYQADSKLSRKYEGAGIGLALVNELLKLMDARLNIASEKGKGSAFTITARLLKANEDDVYPEVNTIVNANLYPKEQISESGHFIDHNLDVPLILIVEDNEELRDFLKNSLVAFYRVITAVNGKEGMDIAISQIPDLIISDVMMPLMDGFELCAKVKAEPASSHIPFIILSAKSTYESKMTGLQKGADDYLTKPFSVDELITKIKNILQRQNLLRKHFLEQISGEKLTLLNSDIPDDFLQKTFKIIEEYIDDAELSVELIAAKMDLNNNTINRKFSFFLGLSANELIRQFRIKKEKMEHYLLEMEAKTLRAQMNPHFIFNCMNSIKSLIQLEEGSKAITYLTTFSKLLRTILQNSDDREISLFDELQTCQLYMQLEAMRFGTKLKYQINIDQASDLKSIKVPALIIQPFIENAIWHGIMPKDEGGTVSLSVIAQPDAVSCIIEDDGIGRQTSKQLEYKINKNSHQSKGISLTKNRLNLDSILNNRYSQVEIIDKCDEQQKPMGTKVVITFNEY